jgi:hypothetical protein
MRIIYLCLLIFTYINCSATNYYVSAKSGNAKFNGLSPAKPKSLIQDAANLTKPGDTVFVMNGTYTNSCSNCNVVDILKSGTQRKYIVYTNYPNHHPVINFDGWGGISIRNGVSYIKVIGFEIVGNNANVTLEKALKQPKSCANKRGKSYDPKYNGNGISIAGTRGHYPHHIVIARNTVHDCGGGGIGASQADYITIEDNLVYNNCWYTVFGASGISFYQFWNSNNIPGYHNAIRRNRCYNNRNLVPWIAQCQITDGNGIIIDDFRNRQNGSRLGIYRGRTLVENNICWYNGGTGIHAFQSDHVDIINNTAYRNSQSQELNSGQILAGASNDIIIANNILVSDQSNVLNSNYSNTNLTYMNNLHFNITYPDKSDDAAISNSTCIIGSNPLFVDTQNSLKANFMLQGMSPAIDHGNLKIYSKGDFNMNMRPHGQAADIGAYEY